MHCLQTVFFILKEFVLTIMSNHNCIIFTMRLFILKQAPQAIERLKFAYPTRPQNFDHISLQNASCDSAIGLPFISQVKNWT